MVWSRIRMALAAAIGVIAAATVPAVAAGRSEPVQFPVCRDEAAVIARAPNTVGAPDVALLRAALASYRSHGCTDAAHPMLVLVDFALHSAQPRMWLIDLVSGAGLDRPIHVAHGKGSDPDHDGFATAFGNRDGSNMSSLGAYRGLERYSGKHGRSLRLDGLDRTNDAAYDRRIVVHTTAQGGLNYVSPDFLRDHGRLGRSLGCFVVMAGTFQDVRAALEAGGFLYAGMSSR